MILPVYVSGLASVAVEADALHGEAVAEDARDDVVSAPRPAPAGGPVGLDAAVASRPSGVVSVPTRVGDSAGAWYRRAAAEHEVSDDLLRALHHVESNAADGCVTNARGSGALGPFQFKRATFRRYGVDGNDDGERDICSFADSLFSAARYLRVLGADGLDDPQTRHALARYGTDPDRVLALARSYRDRTVTAPRALIPLADPSERPEMLLDDGE